MNFDSTTTFAEGSLEEVATHDARKLTDGKGAPSRKHFLRAYAEHLESLKRDRSTK
jgi:hypothetical protein